MRRGKGEEDGNLVCCFFPCTRTYSHSLPTLLPTHVYCCISGLLSALSARTESQPLCMFMCSSHFVACVCHAGGRECAKSLVLASDLGWLLRPSAYFVRGSHLYHEQPIRDWNIQILVYPPSVRAHEDLCPGRKRNLSSL